MKTLSVVVPVYNNEPSLPALFEELGRVEGSLLAHDVQLELIFVDDGSRDRTLEALLRYEESRSNTTVIKLTRNFGASSALKTGLQFVTGDCFVTLPADLQDPPQLILGMAEKWLNGARYVIAEKADGRGDPLWGRLFSSTYYRLVRLFIAPDYPRWGYNVLLVDSSILPHFKRAGKNFNPSLFAYWLGFRPEAITYERKNREDGKSGWTFSKKLTFFLDSILNYSVMPVRCISAIGIVVSLASVLYSSLLVFGAFDGSAGPTRILEVLVFFLLGLIVTVLGMIGEYLYRISNQVNGHPEAVIDAVYGRSSGQG